MGDHSDLPNGQKFLQLRRLQQQNQPLEQLDEVIEEIRELMLDSEKTTSKEQLGRRKEAIEAAATQRKKQQQQDKHRPNDGVASEAEARVLRNGRHRRLGPLAPSAGRACSLKKVGRGQQWWCGW